MCHKPKTASNTVWRRCSLINCRALQPNDLKRPCRRVADCRLWRCHVARLSQAAVCLERQSGDSSLGALLLPPVGRGGAATSTRPKAHVENGRGMRIRFLVLSAAHCCPLGCQRKTVRAFQRAGTLAGTKAPTTERWRCHVRCRKCWTPHR